MAENNSVWVRDFTALDLMTAMTVSVKLMIWPILMIKAKKYAASDKIFYEHTAYIRCETYIMSGSDNGHLPGVEGAILGNLARVRSPKAGSFGKARPAICRPT